MNSNKEKSNSYLGGKLFVFKKPLGDKTENHYTFHKTVYRVVSCFGEEDLFELLLASATESLKDS